MARVKCKSILAFAILMGYLIIIWKLRNTRGNSMVAVLNYVKPGPSPAVQHQSPMNQAKKPDGNGEQDDSKISVFRERYKKWHNVDPPQTSWIRRERILNPNKYFIYRCDTTEMRRCGGWGDRAKGMITAYVIANLTGRVFKIEMLNPDCNLPKYVAPNFVNWELPQSFHRDLTTLPPDTKILDYVEDRKFIKDIYKTNFTELIGVDDPSYVYFKTNFDLTNGLQNTTVYTHELSWMKGLKHDQVIATLFKHLFKLSERLESKLDLFLNDLLPSTRHKLICVHIRTGNLAVSSDPVRVKLSDLPNVWKFVNEHSTSEFHKVFVMSDSQRVVEEAKKQDFKDRVVITSGKISHLDKPRFATVEEECEAFDKVIFDQFVLMNCDVLMVSYSGISRMSAHIRGLDQGLFRLTAEGIVRRSTTMSF